ncbi:hypothetical protein BK133_16070 [Paenibacillus sp. FSL H8-0548]|nr:hypothetical protein BK133_16070 [Paenibacillus sp. FSL H8-0548]
MRHELKSIYSNANLQDRQLKEAEKREVSANVQDRLRAEDAEARAQSEFMTNQELTLQPVLNGLSN